MLNVLECLTASQIRTNSWILQARRRFLVQRSSPLLGSIIPPAKSNFASYSSSSRSRSACLFCLRSFTSPARFVVSLARFLGERVQRLLVDPVLDARGNVCALRGHARRRRSRHELVGGKPKFGVNLMLKCHGKLPANLLKCIAAQEIAHSSRCFACFGWGKEAAARCCA